MSVEDNGLTLQGLAHRLEVLERENAQLRDEVVALRGSDTRSDGLSKTSSLVPRRDGARASGFEGRVSRRSLLSKAGAAAVAAVAAGALLPREAKADHTDDIIQAYRVDTHGVTSHADPASEYAVWGGNNTGGTGKAALHGRNAGSGAGVKGTGGTGVWGSSSTTGHSGVYGEHAGTAGYGVVGDGKGNGAGVVGRNSGGEGVRGEGSTAAEVAGVRGLGKTGVWGSSSAAGYSGVYGQHNGSGYGVVGDGRGLNNAGVVGRNPTGTGVRGEGVVHGVHGKSTSGGTGVYGESVSGYAGAFSGGKAQLRIVPKSSPGKPTTGSYGKGDVYMDSAANLFVCTVGGNPATWRRVQTVAV